MSRCLVLQYPYIIVIRPAHIQKGVVRTVSSNGPDSKRAEVLEYLQISIALVTAWTFQRLTTQDRIQ